MPEEPLDLDRLASLIRLVETYDLAELDVEENGCRYQIRGLRQEPDAQADDIVTAAPGAAGHKPDGAAEERIAVTSPMVGVFFRAPSPGERPFVEVGDPVEAGQIIGIIEAMKVFSEVPCPASGIVDEIAVADAELVKAGQVLLYLRSSSGEEVSNVESD